MKISKLDKVTLNEFMKILASETGHDYDEGLDAVLHHNCSEGSIHLFAQCMTEEMYNKIQEEIYDFEVRGKGFVIYAWSDASSYKFWKEDKGGNYRH